VGQKELKSVIVIGGRVDNSFGHVGEALTVLGSQIDEISREIIDFGKESVSTFKTYDDAMREVQAVGSYTAKEMERLDKLNRQIAQSSTYTNLQSAEALVLIAQAGLELSETEALLPATLNLAMAGSLGLADSVDYLISSVQALGYEMGYADELVDQMAKTASIGMTDIDTLGESLMRLGSGAQMFKGGSVEILSILSAMSQFGHDQRGSQGGTWLRNFMLSLAAPAGSIDDIVDAMEQLGIVEEEIEEYRSSHADGVAAMAVQSLVDEGLQIYDAKGQLLPAIDIIKSLRDTVYGSGKYAEDLTELTGALNESGGDIEAFMQNTAGLTDNALYNVLAKIFGKRGISTALNLISISDEEWTRIISEVENSDGFAKAMADIMQGGIGGTLRELNAAWTELKSTFGESIAPEVQGVAEFLHDVAVDVSNMDDEKLGVLVSGLEALAITGPGLLITGAAFRAIGYLLTPAGGIGLGLATLATAGGVLQELIEMDMKGNFGEMELDMESLSEFVVGLGNDFETAYEDVNKYNEALLTSVDNYKTASEAFSSDLLTAMLTDTTLTQEDQEKLKKLGSDMHASLMEGINLSTAASVSYFQMLFGGEEAIDDPAYQEIIRLTEESFKSTVSAAEELSKGFRDALTSAFEDGTVSEDEYSEIRDWMNAYNDAMAKAAAEAQGRENKIALEKLLFKAQTASLDSIIEYATLIQGARDQTLSDAEDAYLTHRSGLVVDGASKETIEALDAEYRAHAGSLNKPYDDALLRLWEYGIQNSDLSDAYNRLGELADLVLGGEMMPETAMGIMEETFGKNIYADGRGSKTSTRSQISEYLARMIAGWGGYDQLMEKAAMYDREGDGETADYLRRLYAMQQINDKYNETTVQNFDGLWSALFGDSLIASSAMDGYTLEEKFLSDMEAFINDFSLESARRTIEHLSGEKNDLGSYFELLNKAVETNNDMLLKDRMLMGYDKDEFDNIVNSLKTLYDFEKVLKNLPAEFSDSPFKDDIAAWSLLYGNASQNPDEFLLNPLSMEAAIVGLEESAQAGVENAQAYFKEHPGEWIVNISPNESGLPMGEWSHFKPYAEGGRATEASIFGEAGAEWAIPEEHTANTANLLYQAAEASGFTWQDIGKAAGQASGAGSGITLVYSPTIIANDAQGVEEKLKQSKEDLEKWLEERKLIEEIMVYS